ncbi:MAG: rhombosortase [Shewanella sp.]
MEHKRLNNHWGFCLSLACLMLLAYVIDPNQLSYQRSSVAAGAWWQIFSANILHTNAWHLAMNLAGLLIIMTLFPWRLSLKNLWTLFLLLSLIQGIGLFWFYPTTLGFVGLSGILHGLFAYAVVQDLRRKDKWGVILLMAVAAKIIAEQTLGPQALSSQLIGARVADESHLIGAIAGLFLGLLLPFKKGILKTPF